MSRSTFVQTLALLDRSGIKTLRLLGGEPTLHRDFNWFVDEGVKRGFRVVIFSNGIVPDATISHLERFDDDTIGLIINVRSPDDAVAEETAQQAQTFSRLGTKIGLGHNIQERRFDFRFLFDLIDRYGLRRQVRLGIAHRVLDGGNAFLHPKHYSSVGVKIQSVTVEAAERNINLEFDCGFVPCMFPPAFFELPNVDKRQIGCCCGPIPDILPDGTVIHCYPLAAASECQTGGETSIDEMKKNLERRTAMFRSVGIYPECRFCPERASGTCTGGCLAMATERIRAVGNPVRNIKKRLMSSKSVSGVSRQDDRGTAQQKAGARGGNHDPKPAGFIIPYVDQPPEFWNNLHREFGSNIKAVYFPLPENPIGSGRPIQPQEHIHEFLSLSLFANAIVLNPIVLRKPISEIAPRILDALRIFANRHRVEEVTVANLDLAALIRKEFPTIRIAASTLMDIAKSNQIGLLRNVVDVLVPASRIMRDLASVRELRDAFPGVFRLIVNESCLPGCPFRVQHFHEMSDPDHKMPKSLCRELLEETPWLRLTGSWVLPQHLRFYDGLYDELKLAGRVTLNDSVKYRKVLEAYILRRPLSPHEIGGGPAGLLEEMTIEDDFYATTLHCGQRCKGCNICSEYYEHHRNRQPQTAGEEPNLHRGVSHEDVIKRGHGG